MLNMERLIDAMMECNTAAADYRRECMKYYRAHGYGVNIDTARTPEEKHIVWLYHQDAEALHIYWTLCDVLQIQDETRERLTGAVRAVERWYRMTDWQRCLPADLVDRLQRYVFG